MAMNVSGAGSAGSRLVFGVKEADENNLPDVGATLYQSEEFDTTVGNKVAPVVGRLNIGKLYYFAYQTSSTNNVGIRAIPSTMMPSSLYVPAVNNTQEVDRATLTIPYSVNLPTGGSENFANGAGFTCGLLLLKPKV